MFSLAHMVNFFSDKFSSLGGWRFPFSTVFLGSFDSFPFRHKYTSRISFLVRNSLHI
jgi:hypothetical protein